MIAPLVTAGCLLSLYSATGCDFVRVDIGFTPSNDGWNQSTAEFGLFLYQSGEPEIDKYREAFIDGCRMYETEFLSIFIDEDRTWKVARIMAYISGGSSFLAMVGKNSLWSVKVLLPPKTAHCSSSIFCRLLCRSHRGCS